MNKRLIATGATFLLAVLVTYLIMDGICGSDLMGLSLALFAIYFDLRQGGLHDR